MCTHFSVTKEMKARYRAAPKQVEMQIKGRNDKVMGVTFHAEEASNAVHLFLEINQEMKHFDDNERIFFYGGSTEIFRAVCDALKLGGT